jgi:hypothetical protein
MYSAIVVRTILVAVALAVLTGCAATMYYKESGLNALPLGMNKDAFLTKFPEQSRPSIISPPILRAAKRQNSGELVEVFTLAMFSGTGVLTEYWFVFKNKQLAQWGKPEDWSTVSTSYDISFNPSPSVRVP